MPDFIFYCSFLCFLIFLELLYFRIASAKNIIDKPNERSSHSRITIRGGGIIFPIAVLCWFISNDFQYPFFICGVLLVAFVSFLDDIQDLSSNIRSISHFLAIFLLVYQVDLSISWYWYIAIFILLVGFVNAYNFMDGINGITGGYSLVVLGSLLYYNWIEPFSSSELMIICALSLVVFNLFNFRTNAKCFAGDVGSISIAFVISFLTVQAIVHTGNYLFVGFILVYGLDAVSTIVFRLIRKENIFQAHRSHFYQFLSNEKKWAHLRVSLLYSLTQLSVNILILKKLENQSENGILHLLQLGIAAGVIFIVIRFQFEGTARLINSNKTQE